ncbi:MAG: hypothetical protein P1P77_04240 [Spirochaetaceae bacterium]|nr:hypothetical protein [Spirochaetaceae bacterium]
MKRLIAVLIVLQLAAGAVFGQDIAIQISVASRPLDPELLARVGLNRGEIEEVQELQEDFRQVRARTTLEMNLVKAQVARLIYLNENENGEIDRLLERAGELRLEQEKAQVRNQFRIREVLGEERWSELVKRIRTQEQTRNQVQTQTREENPAGQATRNEGESDNGSSSGSSGSSGSSSRR